MQESLLTHKRRVLLSAGFELKNKTGLGCGNVVRLGFVLPLKLARAKVEAAKRRHPEQWPLLESDATPQCTICLPLTR